MPLSEAYSSIPEVRISATQTCQTRLMAVAYYNIPARLVPCATLTSHVNWITYAHGPRQAEPTSASRLKFLVARDTVRHYVLRPNLVRSKSE